MVIKYNGNEWLIKMCHIVRSCTVIMPTVKPSAKSTLCDLSLYSCSLVSINHRWRFSTALWFGLRPPSSSSFVTWNPLSELLSSYLVSGCCLIFLFPYVHMVSIAALDWQRCNFLNSICFQAQLHFLVSFRILFPDQLFCATLLEFFYQQAVYHQNH